MTKSDLVNVVAEKAALTKKDAEIAVNAVFEAITDELAKGEKVAIAGFGGFEVRTRPERKGRNPHTKEEITIAASKKPAFKAAKKLKDSIQ